MCLVNTEKYARRKGEKEIANLSNIRTSLLVACSEAKLEHEVEECRRYHWASKGVNYMCMQHCRDRLRMQLYNKLY